MAAGGKEVREMQNTKVEDEIDECIISVCGKVRKDEFTPGEYADTVKALALLVEARANYMEKKRFNAVVATDEFPQIDVLVKPIVDWLKTQDPYLEIHISSEYIKVVRINESIPVSETVSLQSQPPQTRY